MSKVNRIRWLTGFSVLLAGSFHCLPAQVPSSASGTTAATPSFQPTPEQVGDSLMGHQRYQAALETYKKIAAPAPEVWNKMGIAYQLLYNLAEAERCYRMALKLDPRNAIALNNLGSVAMGRRDYHRAERFYRKALKIDGRSALFHKNLGTVQFAEKKYRQGSQSYQAAIKLDPNVFENRTSVRVENPSSIQDRGAMNFYMAKTCLKAGMVAKAVQYLRLALDEGYTTPKKIMADAELATLRNDPTFQQMLAAQGVYITPLTAHPPVQQ